MHEYIVDNFGSVQNPIWLDENHINQIIEAIQNDELLGAEGETDGSEKERDLQIFNAALAWLCIDDLCLRSLQYQADCNKQKNPAIKPVFFNGKFLEVSKITPRKPLLL